MNLSLTQASLIKLCDERDVVAAIKRGDLSPAGNAQVQWNDLFESWCPVVNDYDLSVRVNDLRACSKTIVRATRQGAFGSARRFSIQILAYGWDVCPVNRENAELLLRIQDGGHDGNTWSDELYEEIMDGLEGGDTFYQLRLHLHIDRYSQGLRPASVVTTAGNLAKRHGHRESIIHRLIKEGKLNAAHYLGATIILLDGAYRRWIEETSTITVPPSLFTPGLLRA